MASGGQPLPPVPLPKSWAAVAASSQVKANVSLLTDGPVLNKLKANTTDFIRLDHDTISRAHMRFQTALYGKFFGKSPPFEQVKEILTAKWNDLGSFQISDLPNGYLLIRCSTHEAMQKLLFEGPWAVNGTVLQLVPWKPYFEPAHSKLSTAALWVQLHNLPVEFWEGEALESISSLFGRLLKIDEFTSSLSRSKYARLCVEIDITKPLKQGFWVGDEEHRVFVVVLYERLPTFCYLCGLVGHGSNSCNRQSPACSEKPSQPRCEDLDDQQRQEVRVSHEHMGEGMDVGMAPEPVSLPELMENVVEIPNTDYGPWMLVSRRRGRGGGRGGARGLGGPGSRGAHVTSRDLTVPLPNVSKTNTTVACPTRGMSSSRGRGGTVKVASFGRSEASGVLSPSSDIDVAHHAQCPGEASKPSDTGDAHNARCSGIFDGPPLESSERVGGVSLSLEENLTVEKEGITELVKPHDKPTLSVIQKGKGVASLQSQQPSGFSPVLRVSLPAPEASASCTPSDPHTMMVDKVSIALTSPSRSPDVLDQEMSDSEEEDEEDEALDGAEMEEPDNLMTLDNYQSVYRKEVLSRKSNQVQTSPQKKGRVEVEGNEP